MLVLSQHIFVVITRDSAEIDSDYDQIQMYNLMHRFWNWKVWFSPLDQNYIRSYIASHFITKFLSWSKLCNDKLHDKLRLIRWSRVLEGGSNRTYFKVYLYTKKKWSVYYIKDVCLTDNLMPNKSLNKIIYHRLLKISLISGKSTCKIGWKYYYIYLRSFKRDIGSTVQTVKGIFQRWYVIYIAQM